MSVFAEAIGAIREALKLADDVKRSGDTIKELARELREHDRRITRLEAQWETAMQLGGHGGSPRRLEAKP
jgi:predicted RNase H-like nuclease (RuvC/YqgF family)